MKHLKQLNRIILLFIMTSVGAQAQVSLAPTIMFIHDNNNIGELYVTNRSDLPQEVTVSFDFGYPTSDSTGAVVMRYGDLERKQRYGLDDYIRVFPRRLVLQGGQSQTLRFQVIPQADRPDGMYWTRAVVTSTPISSDVGLNLDSESVGARVTIALEQNIPLFYRKGNLSTGVIVHKVYTAIEQKYLIIRPHVSREGNSPFLGTISTELLNSSNEVVKNSSQNVFFYFEEYRRIEIPISDLNPGQYRVNLHFDTQRRDISARDIALASRYTHSFIVEF